MQTGIGKEYMPFVTARVLVRAVFVWTGIHAVCDCEGLSADLFCVDRSTCSV